jgi:hypothetical protein
MPDCRSFANDEGYTFIYVTDGVVLNVRVLAYDDGRNVTTQDGTIPDTRPFFYSNVADKYGGRRDICVWRYDGSLARA